MVVRQNSDHQIETYSSVFRVATVFSGSDFPLALLIAMMKASRKRNIKYTSPTLAYANYYVVQEFTIGSRFPRFFGIIIHVIAENNTKT